MEIKFEVATEPAVKGTIAVVPCVSIAYIATHAETPYGFVSFFLSGIIGVIIRTYKTPPLHAPTWNYDRNTSIMSKTVSADSIKAQMPHPTLTRVLGEPTHYTQTSEDGYSGTHRQPHGYFLSLGSQQGTSRTHPTRSSHLPGLQRSSVHHPSEWTTNIPSHPPSPRGTTSHQHLRAQCVGNLQARAGHHSRPICRRHRWRLLRPPRQSSGMT